MFNKARLLLIMLVLLMTACAPKFANSAFCQQAAVKNCRTILVCMPLREEINKRREAMPWLP